MTKSISVALFGFFVLAFCANWILQRNGIHIPLVHAYMDDLICIPVILFPFLFLYKMLVKNAILPLSYIISACVIICVVFELVLPSMHAHHTSDYVDMVLYAMGALLFYFMQKPFGTSTQQSIPRVRE